MIDAKRVLILGIGNVLWADEGFGVRAVETINQNFQFDERVTLLDGGTQGLNLIHHVTDCEILVIFDAIDFGLAPGTLASAEDQDVPKFLSAKKMSLHQTGFQEVLATADLLGKLPEKILLIGVQPQELADYGGSLRPIVKEKIPQALEIARNYLDVLGFPATPRNEPLRHDERLVQPELGLDRYEQERPDAESACRTGDIRFLKKRQDYLATLEPEAMTSELS